MIKVESGSFAALVRSYKKSLNMLAVLQHICEDNSVELSMLPDEVCELINLDPAEIEKQRLSGRLRFAEEENGTRHYSIVDIINLKDSIDWKVINRQVESLSFEEEERRNGFLPFTDKGMAGRQDLSGCRPYLCPFLKSGSLRQTAEAQLPGLPQCAAGNLGCFFQPV